MPQATSYKAVTNLGNLTGSLCFLYNLPMLVLQGFGTLRLHFVPIYMDGASKGINSGQLELLKCKKHATLTIKLLPAAEIVTLNYWSTTDMSP